MHLKILFSLLFVLVLAQAVAQPREPRRGSRIIDDTTKQVYGPTTSKYFYETDVFYNRDILRPIDTVIRNFHRYYFIQRYNNTYQDLGTHGTASRPIFYQSPDQIGVRSGFDAYDLLWNSERIRYFDTKSPYTNMNVILGGRGRSMTRGSYSRNIDPRWNFGIDYRGYFIDKQIPERIGKGDRVARGHYYDFYTSFRSKDSTYRLFANYQRMFHQVAESGGIIPQEDYKDYFVWNDLSVSVNAAESNDLRRNLHLTQQVQAGKGFQVYHTIDKSYHKARFLNHYVTDSSFFHYRDTLEMANDTTGDMSEFRVLRNEIGLKGNINKLFYNGYLGLRNYNMHYNHPMVDSTGMKLKGAERFWGGRMELRLDSIGIVNGWVEFNDEGNFRIEGNIVSKFFTASLRQMSYKPSFFEQYYIGGHNQWQNSFKNIQSTQLSGALNYESKVVKISPGLSLTRLNQYIYFDDGSRFDTIPQIQPYQSNGQQVVISPQFNFRLTLLRHIHLVNQTIYSLLPENANNALRIPTLFVNSQISYSNIFFNGNLDMHVGADLHWRSDYYAPAYAPAIRQFYNQDEFLIEAYPIIDFFLNVKVKRARIFVKYNNFLVGIMGEGYMPTPYYPWQRSVIDFGFDWSFYD